MELEDFRKATRATPWRPFIVKLSDGRELHIRDECSYAFADGRRELVLIHPTKGMELVPWGEISEIQQYGQVSG